MAQQDAASVNDKQNKHRPKPLELQTSNPRHHSTSSEPVDNSHLSPAELYIYEKSQMVFDSNTPLTGTSSVASSSTTPISHGEIMHEWREKQVNQIYKNEPHRYHYETPPSSSNNSLTCMDRKMKK